MALFKRGRIYWTYVYVDGSRYGKSTGTTHRRDAEIVDHRFKEELNRKRQQIVEPRPDMTFGELAARFLAEGSPRAYHLDRLKVLLPYFSDQAIGRITKGLVHDYRKRRHVQKTVSDTTINRDLEALRHMLFWAVDEGFLTANPLSRTRLVPERRRPRPIMTVAEELRLLQAAAPHLSQIIVTALDTGMRRGELLTQRWEHVQLARQLLYVTSSKTPGGEAREIPLTQRLLKLFTENRREQGLIFTFQKRPIHRIKTAWKAAIRRAGLRYFRFHDLRHTFNTRLMEAGVLQEVRKALMGHSSGEDVNSIYTHIELPAKREAIRKLEAWVASQPTTEEKKNDEQSENDNRSDSDDGIRESQGEL